MILEKKNYKKIEHYLYSHFENTERIEIATEDIIYGCKASHMGEENGAGASVSTESKVERAALQLIELHNRENENAKWIEVINTVLNDFEGTEYKELIDLTYKKQIRVTKILMIMHIEKSAYYQRRTDVILQVALRAAEKGLIENRIEKAV